MYLVLCIECGNQAYTKLSRTPDSALYSIPPHQSSWYGGMPFQKSSEKEKPLPEGDTSLAAD
jgi:hypothetical protein